MHCCEVGASQLWSTTNYKVYFHCFQHWYHQMAGFHDFTLGQLLASSFSQQTVFLAYCTTCPCFPPTQVLRCSPSAEQHFHFASPFFLSGVWAFLFLDVKIHALCKALLGLLSWLLLFDLLLFLGAGKGRRHPLCPLSLPSCPAVTVMTLSTSYFHQMARIEVVREQKF